MKRQIFLLFMLGLGILTSFAQTRQINGTVVSSDDGSPIPGVSVFIKGTSLGTVTNIQGEFEMQISDESKILIFRFVGMMSKEVVIGSQTTFNIEMETDVVGLEEVVVTALGISRDKKSLGYASTTVSGTEISEAQVVNPMNALQGKVAGVDISTAPGPGSTQNVMIRGASSFANNQPLYVIDGVPITNEQITGGDNLNWNVDYGSGLNAVNPDDIENMTILKGAAATALYGSRAANGVILIKTKAGKNTNGKMQISYDGSFTVQNVGRIPERQDMFGQGWSGDHALDENGNWGPKYDGKMRLWGFVVDNSQLLKPYAFVESRVRDFYDYGISYKNAISASGGNENTNYFMSFSHNSTDGVLPDDVDTYERITISTKGSHKWRGIKLSSSVNYSNETTNVVPSGQGNSAFKSLWEIAEDYSIVDFKDYNDPFFNLENYFTPYGVNPYFSLHENGSSQKKHKVFGKAQMDLDITDELSLTYRFGGDLELANSERWVAIIDNPEEAPSYNGQKQDPGYYAIYKRTRYEVNHDAFFNYKKGLNERLRLNTIAGINVNERGYTRVGGSLSSLDVPGYYNLSNGTSDPVAEQYKEKRRLWGAFGNAELIYNDYLYFTVTARNDWSSTLPQGNNSYFYPGATGSIILSDLAKENGMELKGIDFAKLRIAYGWTGNDADVYNIYPVFEKGYVENPGYPGNDDLELPLNGVNSWMIADQLGSPDLSPEITKEYEFGLEMNLFSNRLGFDVSYFNKLTEGLIAKQPLDPSSGYTFIVNNIGDVRNKGVELLVFGSPIRTNNFEWIISANYTKIDNKVEKLAEGEVILDGYGAATIVAVEGMEMGVFKTNVTQTVEINGKDCIVVDGNGLPVASPDQVVLEDKSVNEDFRAGLTNTFRYKSFALSGTLDLRYGGYIYSFQKDYMGWTGSGPETVYNDRNPFVIPNSVILVDGEYIENTYPVNTEELHEFYTDGGFEQIDGFFLDRSYLKLREVKLTYDLPRRLANKIGVANIRASLIAGNILLWTPAENVYIDPETTTFGNDIGAKFGEFGGNPTNQNYTFGLSVTF